MLLSPPKLTVPCQSALDKILSNVTLGAIDEIADDQIDSNLEKDKEKDLDQNNALDMSLLRAATVEAQSKHAHMMMMRKDPVCQLTEEKVWTITDSKTMKKVKRASESTLGRALNPRQQMKVDLDGLGSTKLGVDFVPSFLQVCPLKLLSL